MFMSQTFLLPMAVMLGWFGTRTSLHLHHSTKNRGDALFLLVVSWSPLVLGLLALLLALTGSPS